MTERISLAVPDLRGNENAYLARCVQDNWVSSAGPFVTECEKQIAALAGRAYAVASVNGTTALQLAMTAAGVKPGDHVVVPDWTFAATANAAHHAGATPIFADVTEESWSLDPAVLEAILRDPPGRIAAVVVVHALGHPADIDPLLSLCRTAGIPLIEDAAGAIGARYKGRPVGGLGDMAIFSFNGNKTVTAGGGGMVVTDDESQAKRLRAISAQARSGTEYRYDEIGFNYRMTNLNAGVLLAQIERMEEMVAAKRRIAAVYDRAVTGRNDLRPMPRTSWGESACWLYSVRCRGEAEAHDLVQHMAEYNIEARTFWRTLSDQAPYAHAPRRLTGVAAKLSGTVVSLPCSSSLTDEQQARVIAALGKWPRRAGR
ncbi:MAG: aminotransferase class I/II-fold pyridoxal phosphate-dependent enzyme [Alphaproteobacteria bacterium]